MGLTDIGNQLTPATPTEITFATVIGTPDDTQEVTLIGHRGEGAASGSSGIADYQAVSIQNAGDPVAASGEAAGYFGAGSELAAMVVAAVTANQGNATFPPLRAIPLDSADEDFGSGEAALVTAERYKAEFLVSPYDGSSSTLLSDLNTAAQLMSGPSRVSNNQYGTTGVAHIRSVTNTGSLPSPDSQNLMVTWMPDTDSPSQSVGVVAAAAAAFMSGIGIPFNPQDGVVIPGLIAPALDTDWISVGDGLQSEEALQKGITPLRVLPSGGVAFVRTITTRLTLNGVPVGDNYIDVQDFQQLYYWRRTVVTFMNQPQIKNIKASANAAQKIKGGLVTLAGEFEDDGMFQGTANAAKDFVVQRNATDRSRFDVLTPVDVIPGLHEVATNIQATTAYDALTV